MSPFVRKFATILTVASALVGTVQPAAAAMSCVPPAERDAFDLRALQSQLMVVALVCGQQADYNAFVQRHRTGLLSAYQRLGSHFGKAYGSSGVAQRDAYITELANYQSQYAIRQGISFCTNGQTLYQTVLAAKTIGDAVRSSANRVVHSSYSPAACEVSVKRR